MILSELAAGDYVGVGVGVGVVSGGCSGGIGQGGDISCVGKYRVPYSRNLRFISLVKTQLDKEHPPSCVLAMLHIAQKDGWPNFLYFILIT